MGFIIHKYLSKSLKAPEPSSNNNNNGNSNSNNQDRANPSSSGFGAATTGNKAKRHNSLSSTIVDTIKNAGVASSSSSKYKSSTPPVVVEPHLTIPKSAYASNNRRGSMSSMNSSSAGGSGGGGGSKMKGRRRSSHGGGGGAAAANYRRASLQHLPLSVNREHDDAASAGADSDQDINDYHNHHHLNQPYNHYNASTDADNSSYYYYYYDDGGGGTMMGGTVSDSYSALSAHPTKLPANLVRRASLQHESTYRRAEQAYYSNMGGTGIGSGISIGGGTLSESVVVDHSNSSTNANANSHYYQPPPPPTSLYNTTVKFTMDDAFSMDGGGAGATIGVAGGTVVSRRGSMGTVTSVDSMGHDTITSTLHDDMGGTSHHPYHHHHHHHSNNNNHSTNILTDPQRLHQENRWLQLQLRDQRAKYRRLEAKLYGARDQLAYQNASWINQLHNAQSKHATEIFQNQRQAEQAANSILEKELNEWRQTLQQFVQQKEKEATANSNTNTNNSLPTLQDKTTTTISVIETKEETKEEAQIVPPCTPTSLNKLYAELQSWKNRHAQATENSTRIQQMMQQELEEREAQLVETKRRVEWLEMELKAAFPSPQQQQNRQGQYNDDDDDDDDDDDNDNRKNKNHFKDKANGAPFASPVGHIALLQIHKAQLEDRIQELLLEVAKLQKNQGKVGQLTDQVQELEKTLIKERQEATLKHSRDTRQMEKWERRAASLDTLVKNLEQKLKEQTTTRESIRMEYVHRLEQLEVENCELSQRLEKAEQHWMHQLNLKQRTIEILEQELAAAAAAAAALNEEPTEQPGIITEEGSGELANVPATVSLDNHDNDDLLDDESHNELLFSPTSQSPRKVARAMAGRNMLHVVQELPVGAEATTPTSKSDNDDEPRQAGPTKRLGNEGGEDIPSVPAVNNESEEKNANSTTLAQDAEYAKRVEKELELEKERAKNRERELLLLISNLTKSEAEAQKRMQEAEERAELYQSYLQKDAEESGKDEKHSVDEVTQTTNEVVTLDSSSLSQGSNEVQPQQGAEESVSEADTSAFSVASQTLHERLEKERQRLANRRSRLRSKLTPQP